MCNTRKNIMKDTWYVHMLTEMSAHRCSFGGSCMECKPLCVESLLTTGSFEEDTHLSGPNFG